MVNTMMLKAYLAVANKIHDFKENMKKEDGMETVQAIILVVVGLVIVAALIGIMKKFIPEVGNKMSDVLNESIGS